jgi:hypothetical protein
MVDPFDKIHLRGYFHQVKITRFLKDYPPGYGGVFTEINSFTTSCKR